MKTSIIVSLSLGVFLSGCAHSHLRSGSTAAASAGTTPVSVAASDQSAPYPATTTVSSGPAYAYSPAAETNPQRVEATAGDQPTAGPSAPTASVAASFAYTNNATVSAERLRDWKLTAEDVSTELRASGQIVRVRTMNPGEASNPPASRVNELITTKLHNNPDTYGLPLQFTLDDGTARLTGTAHSPDQIGKAVALTLDTPGVRRVVSTIATDATRTP